MADTYESAYRKAKKHGEPTTAPADATLAEARRLADEYDADCLDARLPAPNELSDTIRALAAALEQAQAENASLDDQLITMMADSKALGDEWAIERARLREALESITSYPYPDHASDNAYGLARSFREMQDVARRALHPEE